MKTSAWILLSFFTVLKLQAQDFQVTLVDPCATIDKKSTIIIDDNATTANALSRPVSETNTVNFTLTSSVNTSAGVYNGNGNLIRTLWNGVRYDAGNYKAIWNGIMDDGTQAPPGNYQFRVLTNNVKYTWEGVIGNTSSSLTDNVFKSYGGNTCFAFVGTKGFYGQFFYEGGTNSKYFNLNDIGRSYDINVGVHAITLDCATDGTNIYWACADQYQNNGINNNQSNYIFATKASDNSAVPFTSQTTHNSGRENEAYSHFIGWFTDANSVYYNGIAVNSNFIFATKSTNQLFVFNKISGSIVQTINCNNPGKLAAGSNNEVWIVVNNVLKKFMVNPATGVVTDTGIIANAISPSCVRISPDNTTVLITDAGTHQVKAYANSTGALLWSLGQQGGYDTNGPAVTTDKFMFNRAEYASPAIGYQPDGSFWVNDMGNYRTLHFNADRTYKEQIMYMPSSRSTNADPNNPTCIFGDELEFKRDYTKSLDNGTNGSWKLVNNWKVGTILDGFRRFNQVVTLSNGHTYATGNNGSGGGYLYDLTSTGAKQLRSDFDGLNYKIEADGSLVYWANNNNQNIIVHKQTLQSFNNTTFEPNWGNDVIIVTTPNFTTTSPYFFINNTRGAATNPRKYFFFNPVANINISYILNGATLGQGYHFAGIKTGQSTYDFQTSKSTFFDYHGDYPRNGDYDLGNNDYLLQHSENCQTLVQGTDIFWNVNAEFWQANSGASGVNIWNHFNENGLLVGNFGVTGPEARENGEYGMAGNSFSTVLVKVGNDYYIYHCDENRHAGVHSWHVTGLNTIAEQSIPIDVSLGVTIAADVADLNAGLPFQSTTFTGDDNWIVDVAPPGFVIKTSKFQYSKSSVDIYISGDKNEIVRRKLNNTQTLTSWKLSGMMSFDLYGQPTIGADNYNYLEVLDTNGKIIARFSDNADTRNSYYHSTTINKTTVAQGDANAYPGFNRATTGISFSFSYNNGSLTFSFKNFNPVTLTNPFETGANLAAPGYLRVNQGGTGGQNHVMDLYHLQFNSKK